MLSFLSPYLLLIGLVAGFMAFGYVAVLKIENASLRADVKLLNDDLSVCLSRSANILEDQASDREIDNLDADALRDLARRWMLDNPAP